MHVTKGRYNKIWMFLLAACILFILLFVLHVGHGQEAPSAQNGKQVLMIYMVGSNLESERGLASADIKEIQESIGCINYLDTILGEHYIVDLNYESEIYEIGLSNLLLSKPQKVRKVQRHKIDKNNLEELKNDYIR